MEAAATIMEILVHNAVVHADPGPSSIGRQITLHYAMTDKHDLLIDVYDPLPAFPDFEGAVDGEKGRGLWTVRQMGGELSWALCDGGKVVRAMLRRGPVPA
ncbi:ATP-binding protein (plasmid) [Streptomyces sp. NBC_01732]|uniref:ATP-binding protein n=1 Tax=Streptomyces sp. NBC_01732 TaxID=2975926 RepID=UPI00352E1AE7|nr:ATP-binding protein [Streptomyces sp. NBC_01732]